MGLHGWDEDEDEDEWTISGREWIRKSLRLKTIKGGRPLITKIR